MNIKEELNKIIATYYHADKGPFENYDELEKIKSFFKSKGVQYKIELREGYVSYDCCECVAAIAWLENGKIEIKTLLFYNYI